jgi:two-component system, response regulator RegA
VTGRRLLLVDDDAVYRQVLGRAFVRRGHAVTEAADAAGALSAATASGVSFDGIVLDLRLGEDSGLHALAALRAAQPAAKILLLTGYASIATAVDAIKRGADDYLPKPAPADDILAALFGAAVDAVVPATPVHPRRLEWEHLQRVMAEHAGNVSAAARALGLHRRSLQRKLGKKPQSER